MPKLLKGFYEDVFIFQNSIKSKPPKTTINQFQTLLFNINKITKQYVILDIIIEIIYNILLNFYY